MRTIGLLLFWLITVVSVLLGMLSWMAVHFLTSRELLFTQLRQSGLYDQLSEQLSTGLSRQLNSKDLRLDEPVQQALVKVINENLLTPATMQEIVERNVTNFFLYLDGAHQEVVIFLPISTLKNFVQGSFAGTFTNEVVTQLQALPTCTSAQAKSLAKEDWGVGNFPSCLPSDLKKNTAALRAKIKPASQSFNANDIPFMQDEETISQLYQELNVVVIRSGGESIKDPTESLQNIRSRWQILKLAPLYLGLTSGCVIIVLILLNWGRWRSALVWISTALFVAGIILFTAIALSQLLVGVFVGLLPTGGDSVGVGEGIKQLFNEVVQSFLRSGLILSLAALGSALLLLLPSLLWPRAHAEASQ